MPGTKRSVAIAGSDTLLAREIQRVLAEQAPDMEVSLIGDEADSTILAERNGEPAVISALNEAGVAKADVVILTGDRESCSRALDIASGASAKPAILDMTAGADDAPESRVSAPLAVPDGPAEETGLIHRVAHPAAAVLAEFLCRLHAASPVRRSVANVFAPASERGRRGIGELQKQTVSLLSFKPLPQEVFDAQLAFAMLPAYGVGASVSLQSVEAQIGRHVRLLLGRAGAIPAPSLRLIQAPVFHGLSFSLWAEFEGPVSAPGLAAGLASDRIEVRGADEEPATNTGVAGLPGMIVSRIESDPREPNAAWFWIVADNHRVSADNAVCLARLLAPGEGSA